MAIDFGISHLKARELVNELTPRERQVAEGIAMGETRQEIARQLGISIKTVDCHLCHVREKLGVQYQHGIPRIWFAAMIEDEGKR